MENGRLNIIDMKNLFIKSVVLVLASAATVHASAQATMSLHDCMAYAISNSTKMRIQQAAIGDAQISRRDAALALFTTCRQYCNTISGYVKT